jgi:serine/threonine protein kinase
MKACTGCGRLYPEGGFCPVDGLPLEDAADVPIILDDSDTRIGATLCGRYEVRRIVADGGTGRVYEALDTARERSVAVKVLHPEVVANEIALERFKREFLVSAQLPHRHIVEVLDFQPTEDRSFALVMELLYGEELRATLQRVQVLSPGRLVRMMSQVAVALDEAHASNFVHRDLKPDNLFLCQTKEGDNVKVLDFGSVKDTGEGAKKLTVVGTTIGSPFYMSPEQAQGLDTLDQRADVWALGAIAYECITATVPFVGTNGPSILLAIVTTEPTPPSVAAEGRRFRVPCGVDEVIARALKKSSGARTRSAGEFAEQLGLAYGLQGDHHGWAVTPEDELERRIEERMPALLAAPRRLASPASGESAPSSDELDRAVDLLVQGIEPVQGGDAMTADATSSATAGAASVAARAAPAPARGWILPVIMLVALITGVLIALLVP